MDGEEQGKQAVERTESSAFSVLEGATDVLDIGLQGLQAVLEVTGWGCEIGAQGVCAVLEGLGSL